MERKSNIFTHKFLPLFGLFCFILLCFFTTNVSAYSHTYNEKTFTVDDRAVEACLNYASTATRSSFIIYRLGSTGALRVFFFIQNNDLNLYLNENNQVNITYPSSFMFERYTINETNFTLEECDLTSARYRTLTIETGDNITLYSSVPIKMSETSSEYFYVPPELITFRAPHLANTNDFIENPDFEYFFIYPGDVGTDTFYVTIQEDYYPLPDINTNYGRGVTYELFASNSFFEYDENGDIFYKIPKHYGSMSDFSYLSGKSYTFTFKYTQNGEDIYSSENFTISYKTDEEILNDNLLEEEKKTQNLIVEGNETNKNIFQKIGDIFNILNPFSDSFFGKTLVNLIVDGLKGLFIPEDGYFDNYFQELQDWFSDRLGFLYYPLDLLFSLFDRFLELGNGSLSINIPEIKEPFTGLPFINAQTLDFNELLANETLSGMHNIYLLIMDASIYIGLVVLLYHKYEKVVAS